MISQNTQDYLEMALSSVLTWADWVEIVDGKSTDKSLDIINSFNDERIFVTQHLYNQSDPMMNGKQRNYLLDILKEKHMGDWCLVIDPDEVVSNDGARFRELMDQDKMEVLNVHMRHIVYHLGLEDATVQTHWTLGRCFKITPYLSYPEIEHPVLQSNHKMSYNYEGGPVLWHLSLAKQMFDILKKYKKDLRVSTNTHQPEFLRQWYERLLFGQYSVKPITDTHNYPLSIKKYFMFEQ